METGHAGKMSIDERWREVMRGEEHSAPREKDIFRMRAENHALLENFIPVLEEGARAPAIKTGKFKPNRYLILFLSACFWFSQEASTSLYDDFEINPSATQDEIERAWKKRIRAYHPDKHINGDKGLSPKEAEKIFVFLNGNHTLAQLDRLSDGNEAPELEPYITLKTGFYILRDPDLRKKFDEWLNSSRYEEDIQRQDQEAADSVGRNPSSRASGRTYTNYEHRTGRQNANKNHLSLHEIIGVTFAWKGNPKEKDEAILDTIQASLKGNVNIDETDFTGKTVLHLAVEQAYMETARLLLRSGADPNIPDNSGLLPIHSAFYAPVYNSGSYPFYYYGNRHEESIYRFLTLLESFKADLTQKDPAGKTVMATAMDRRFFRIIEWLVQRYGTDYLSEKDLMTLSVLSSTMFLSSPFRCEGSFVSAYNH